MFSPSDHTGLVVCILSLSLSPEQFKYPDLTVCTELYLHQVHDQSVHSDVAESSSEEHRLQLLLVYLEHVGEGQEEPSEPDLAARVLVMVLGTAVLLQHEVGLVLQDLHLQRVTQPAGVRVEEDESLETGELCVVQSELGDPVDRLAELRVGGVGGEGDVDLPLGEGEDEEVGPAVLQQDGLVTAVQLLE